MPKETIANSLKLLALEISVLIERGRYDSLLRKERRTLNEPKQNLFSKKWAIEYEIVVVIDSDRDKKSDNGIFSLIFALIFPWIWDNEDMKIIASKKGNF